MPGKIDGKRSCMASKHCRQRVAAAGAEGARTGISGAAFTRSVRSTHDKQPLNSPESGKSARQTLMPSKLKRRTLHKRKPRLALASLESDANVLGFFSPQRLGAFRTPFSQHLALTFA